MTSPAEGERPVILFDGVCNLCTGSVQFVIERDSRKRFRFASLQSPVAEKLLGRRDQLESVVLVEGGKTYRKSTAALRIARQLDGLWPALWVLLVIPPVPARRGVRLDRAAALPHVRQARRVLGPQRRARRALPRLKGVRTLFPEATSVPPARTPGLTRRFAGRRRDPTAPHGSRSSPRARPGSRRTACPARRSRRPESPAAHEFPSGAPRR